jgi:nucleotide-binding universal stress UspA family protein
VTFRKILVPFDFSDCAEAALKYAVSVAERLDSAIEVVHAVAPPPYVPLDLMLWGPPQRGDVERVAEQLERRVRELSEGSSVKIDCHVRTGVPYDVIFKAADAADLVVMGSHGRTGLPRVMLGSVAERTVRVARCPVLTVPLHERPTAT